MREMDNINATSERTQIHTNKYIEHLKQQQ